MGTFSNFYTAKTGEISAQSLLQFLGVGRPNKLTLKTRGQSPNLGVYESEVFDITGVGVHIARSLAAKFVHVQH